MSLRHTRSDTRIKTVAVLTAGHALSALVEMVLAVHPALRVRVFADAEDLAAYARVAPVHVVLCEFIPGPDGASAVIPMLRRLSDRLEVPNFQAIALSGTIEAGMKQLCDHAGIDEVIAKPMSPSYLEDRVLARARLVAPALPRPVSPAPATGGSGNVIPLFPQDPAPQPVV